MPMSPFQQAIHHAYAQTDGAYCWPNSREGDMLREAKREIDALHKEVAAWRSRFPELSYRPQDECVALR